MTHIAEAKEAIIGLHQLTIGFLNGSQPDAQSVLGYQSKMVRLHALLSEEMSRTFGNKERAYLNRKIEQAKQHAHGRVELKLTSKDAEEAAFISVRQRYEDEISRMEEYELMRALLRSLQNALDYSRQVVSYLKTVEHSPPNDA